jgi:hypothetical protein
MYNRIPMRAFEVSLNGKKLCLAGIGDDGVLTTIVNWVTRRGEGDLFLEVGGLISLTEEHVSWIKQKPLSVGDKIQVKIVEASSADKPTKKYRMDPAEQLRSQKRYVRMMAKQLGWEIQVRPKRSTSQSS